MDTRPILVTFQDTPSDRRYMQRPRSFALALAPAIHMALQTRNIDDGKQTSPPPSIDAIERWIVATFPSHRPCYDYTDIFWGITKSVYPPVHWNKFSDPAQAHEVLRAGRLVLVSLTLQEQEWQLLHRLQTDNILTRALYRAQPESEDTRWGPCYMDAVLWTGYDPATGVCTFIDPKTDVFYNTRYNGTFKVGDIGLLTTIMPLSKLRFYDFHCHPGKVIKLNKFRSALRCLSPRPMLRAGPSLVPNPFAEYHKEKKKPWRPKEDFVGTRVQETQPDDSYLIINQLNAWMWNTINAAE
ncbi:hypothetical protein QBC37DRAFT_372178 [Rhypophila decipiens]|uniref:Uncharacterized protein n=1 Tax=Rhypophila decipiens TaxID=261697 RepID=A0AAN7B746_9PEZI|nr:hypothetical protein QBC37DRAFT_372178 [Rhypophila decipiens]